MSSKLTELTESFPSAMPPSVICGSGVLGRLASPSMASSGHSNPSQTYDGYKAVEVHDPACTEFFGQGVQASNVRRYLWSRKDGPFGKEFPVFEAPTSDGTSGFSNFEVGHPSSTSSSQPLANRFHSHIIPSTPRTFQPTLAAIPTSLPPASPSPSHSRPALNQAVRPSPIQKPRNSPITTSQHLQPMASSSRRRDGFSPLPFPAAQVFQRRDP
ncbi:hypothetical protein O181_094602 [Austropuccinia psidii MF-1]|uniref:Uncharacterized protein n=1 Tax=Austropuccinia psidii MF-1 TaxID=1389203 RepID=A0A9Q3PBN6_9BASI|nr:hypothetical protein [Austropuccinia psidii MF-1]